MVTLGMGLSGMTLYYRGQKIVEPATIVGQG